MRGVLRPLGPWRQTSGDRSERRLPFPFSSKRSDQPFRAGPYGAFLGAAANPVWTEFVGQGTKQIRKARPGFEYIGPEPYLGCSSDSHFKLAATDSLAEVAIDRFDRRRSLVEQFDLARRDLEKTVREPTTANTSRWPTTSWPRPRSATPSIFGPRTKESKTVTAEPCLGSRASPPAGWLKQGPVWSRSSGMNTVWRGNAWDTHYEHFPRMVDQLLPGLDKALSGLILDWKSAACWTIHLSS